MDVDKQKLLLLLKGVTDTRKAFTGPVEVHIDLTNNCNNNCIGCWCRSPLLEELEMAPKVKKQKLSYPVAIELISELADFGIKKIKLTGGGEPFTHPAILKIIQEIKKLNIPLDVNTNFTLVNKYTLKKIVKFGVDSLTASVWAGTEETYKKIHPKMKPYTFKKIKENLSYVNELKRQNCSIKPFVNVYNVILNLNYHEINQMLDFAFETGVDATQFVVLDPIPGKTEQLLLNDDQKKYVFEILKSILKDFDPVTQIYYNKRLNRSVMMPGLIGEFMRRLSHEEKKGRYDTEFVSTNPCYAGWLFTRIMASGDVVPCLKAHCFPLGNINKQSFRNIWNSKRYEDFRNKSLLLSKQDTFFKKMGNDRYGCYKTCDNIWQNEAMDSIILTKDGKSYTPNLRNLNLTQ